MNYIRVYYLFFLLFLLACETSSDKEKHTSSEKEPATEDVKMPVPDFNADSAYAFIEKQVNFGPRVPNTKAHAECAAYLEEKLKSYNFDVVVQKAQVRAFDNSPLNIKNIIAQFKPEQTNRILLFAHWDTRPFADQDTENKNKPIDGANDGGSGVGILLEIARQISLSSPATGVDIILFDAEDYGQPEGSMAERKADTYCLGSQYWAKNLHKDNYTARFGILLDMVGSENATFTMEATSVYYAPYVVKKVWDTAAQLGYGNYFINKKTDGITDDHVYVNAVAGIPSIDIIHHDENTRSNFGAYWHTHKDNMSIISKNTIKAVGQTVITVLYREK